MIPIRKVTVLGANGTMGSNISAIFASFGNAKVYMVGRDIEKTKIAALHSANSVRSESILKNLIPVDYTSLEHCIHDSDWVFECVAENLETKLDILRRIIPYLSQNTIISSGTSGLSLERLALELPEHLRHRYFGVHMFNPPYNLPLCELCATSFSSSHYLEFLREYLSTILFRAVIEVRDKPAFLANRIGFQFINDAMQAAEKYQDNGGIDFIDAILGPFSGRSMPPLLTADFVGLDVHKAIVDNLYANTYDYAHDSFLLPSFVQKLIDQNKLGRKNGVGLYTTEIQSDGSKRHLVYDIASDSYRDIIPYTFPFIQKMISALKIGDYDEAIKALISNHSKEAELCLDFLLKYIAYSVYCSSEVAFDIHAADTAMGRGFNWCPPLAAADAFARVTDFPALLKTRLSDTVDEKVLDNVCARLTASYFNFRPFFRAG